MTDLDEQETEDLLRSAFAARAAEVEPLADSWPRLAARTPGGRAPQRRISRGAGVAAAAAAVLALLGVGLFAGDDEVGTGPTDEASMVGEATGVLWPTGEPDNTWPDSPEHAAQRFYADVVGVDDVAVGPGTTSAFGTVAVYSRDARGVPTDEVTALVEPVEVGDGRWGVAGVFGTGLDVTASYREDGFAYVRVAGPAAGAGVSVELLGRSVPTYPDGDLSRGGPPPVIANLPVGPPGTALIVTGAGDVPPVTLLPTNAIPPSPSFDRPMWPIGTPGPGWPASPEEAARRFFADVLDITDVTTAVTGQSVTVSTAAGDELGQAWITIVDGYHAVTQVTSPEVSIEQVRPTESGLMVSGHAVGPIDVQFFDASKVLHRALGEAADYWYNVDVVVEAPTAGVVVVSSTAPDGSATAYVAVPAVVERPQEPLPESEIIWPDAGFSGAWPSTAVDAAEQFYAMVVGQTVVAAEGERPGTVVVNNTDGTPAAVFDVLETPDGWGITAITSPDIVIDKVTEALGDYQVTGQARSAGGPLYVAASGAQGVEVEVGRELTPFDVRLTEVFITEPTLLIATTGRAAEADGWSVTATVLPPVSDPDLVSYSAIAQGFMEGFGWRLMVSDVSLAANVATVDFGGVTTILIDTQSQDVIGVASSLHILTVRAEGDALLVAGDAGELSDDIGVTVHIGTGDERQTLGSTPIDGPGPFEVTIPITGATMADVLTDGWVELTSRKPDRGDPHGITIVRVPELASLPSAQPDVIWPFGEADDAWPTSPVDAVERFYDEALGIVPADLVPGFAGPEMDVGEIATVVVGLGSTPDAVANVVKLGEERFGLVAVQSSYVEIVSPATGATVAAGASFAVEGRVPPGCGELCVTVSFVPDDGRAVTLVDDGEGVGDPVTFDVEAPVTEGPTLLVARVSQPNAAVTVVPINVLPPDPASLVIWPAGPPAPWWPTSPEDAVASLLVELPPYLPVKMTANGGLVTVTNGDGSHVGTAVTITPDDVHYGVERIDSRSISIREPFLDANTLVIDGDLPFETMVAVYGADGVRVAQHVVDQEAFAGSPVRIPLPDNLPRGTGFVLIAESSDAGATLLALEVIPVVLG